MSRALREVVVISGKGGTGKTSILASFAALGRGAVVADCDVDAADLHLVLDPQVRETGVFRSGREARVRASDCMGCGLCAELCRFEAVREVEHGGRRVYAIDGAACEGCGVCVSHCPNRAVDFEERMCGEWFVSETRHGPMAHARLYAAGENSGKLVSLVREHARQAARACGRELILIDGSPGIGCPVIASLTGASLGLIVTEPTVSGLHDLERIAQVASHFGVPTCVCVNKWDLNPEVTKQIEEFAVSRGLRMAGRVRYDDAVTRAQIAGRALVEFSESGAAGDVREVWAEVLEACDSRQKGGCAADGVA